MMADPSRDSAVGGFVLTTAERQAVTRTAFDNDTDWKSRIARQRVLIQYESTSPPSDVVAPPIH